MRAEIRGIVEGMKLAWNKGIRKLRIQSDSKAAVEMLVNRRNPVGQHSNLVEQFFELSSRPWEVSIHHIYREANYAANYLANFGHSFGFVVHVLDAPDSSLLYWLNFDAVGSCTTRLIPNNIM
ncbi:Putative ribonuclease H protein At1g65750 [Linum perenne]